MVNETADGETAYMVAWEDKPRTLLSYSYGWNCEELYEISGSFMRYELTNSKGEKCVVSAADLVVQPAFGKIVSLLYQMLCYCMVINLSLAVFNLIPLPPLDGYHVLNDTVLHQNLFAQRRTQQISGMVLLALIMIGRIISDWNIIGKVINWVWTGITGELSSITYSLAQALGVF